MEQMQDKRPRVAKNLTWQRNTDRWVVIDPDRPAWASVNDSGKTILGLCTGRRTVAGISKHISQQCNYDYDAINSDLIEFLQGMEDAGIVHFETIKRPKLKCADPQIEEIVLEITGRCNLRCKHCYAEWDDKNGEMISFANAKAFIDRFLAAGGKEITITGGEPLTHPDFKDILTYIKSTDVSLIKVLTNGTLINDHIARFLNAPKIMVQISLDGATAETNDKIRGEGNYEAAMRGIRTLIKQGVRSNLIISMTPNRYNLHEIADTVELALKLKVGYIHFSRLAKQGRSRKAWQDMKLADTDMLFLYETLKAYKDKYDDKIKFSGVYGENFVSRIATKAPPSIGCDVGRGIRIRADGHIFPCPRFDDLQYSLGHIDTVDFAEMKRDISEIRSLLIRRVHEVAQCSGCTFRYFCGSGCLADAVLEKGTVWTSDPRCALRKKFYNNYLDQAVAMKASASDG